MAADELPGPFDLALREACAWLANAHGAALGTLEAELQHMRRENMWLRARLAEAAAGLAPSCERPAAGGACAGACAPPAPVPEPRAASTVALPPPADVVPVTRPRPAAADGGAEGGSTRWAQHRVQEGGRLGDGMVLADVQPKPRSSELASMAPELPMPQGVPAAAGTAEGRPVASVQVMELATAPAAASTFAAAADGDPAPSDEEEDEASVQLVPSHPAARGFAGRDTLLLATTGEAQVIEVEELGSVAAVAEVQALPAVGLQAAAPPQGTGTAGEGRLSASGEAHEPGGPQAAARREAELLVQRREEPGAGDAGSARSASKEPALSGQGAEAVQHEAAAARGAWIEAPPQRPPPASGAATPAAPPPASAPPAPAAQPAPGAGGQDLGRQLEAVFAHCGWQHIDVRQQDHGGWSIAGVNFHVKSDAHAAQNAAPPGGPPFRLLASDDGGRSWEALEVLIRKRRLQKVVRTAPIATGTVEYHVGHPAAEPLPRAGRAGGSSMGSAPQTGVSFRREAPMSLADLASIPMRRVQGAPGPRAEAAVGVGAAAGQRSFRAG